MKSYQQKAEKRQLYFLIDTLKSSIPNENFCGSIIGYSIAKNLGTYIAQEFGRQPKAHREIQSIYESLEESKESLLALSDQACASDIILLERKSIVDPLINVYTTGQKKDKHQSHLFEQMLNNIIIKHHNIEAYLTDFGNELSEKVTKKGILLLKGNRVYNDDYEIVESCLFKKF